MSEHISSEHISSVHISKDEMIQRLYGLDTGASHLADAKALSDAMAGACRAAGATLLNVFLHEFEPFGGVTGVALLAESHISIHTWPESGYAAIDIFMCGHADTRRALDVLILQLKPTHTLVEHLVRGRDRAIRPRVKNPKASG